MLQHNATHCNTQRPARQQATAVSVLCTQHLADKQLEQHHTNTSHQHSTPTHHTNTEPEARRHIHNTYISTLQHTTTHCNTLQLADKQHHTDTEPDAQRHKITHEARQILSHEPRRALLAQQLAAGGKETVRARGVHRMKYRNESIPPSHVPGILPHTSQVFNQIHIYIYIHISESRVTGCAILADVLSFI